MKDDGFKHEDRVREKIRKEDYESVIHLLYGINFSYDEMSALYSMINEIKEFSFCKKIKVAILSSYTIKNIEQQLWITLFQNKFNAEFFFGEYNQYMQEILDRKGSLYEFRPDIIIIALDFEIFFGLIEFAVHNSSGNKIDEIINKKLSDIRKIALFCQENLNVPILLTNIALPHYSPYGIRDINMKSGLRLKIMNFNEQLTALKESFSNLFIIDFDKIASFVGKKSLTESKYYYIGKIYLGKEIVPFFCYEISGIISSLYGNTKKCIVVDLDNTIWGGVIGEGGLKNIELGDTGIGAIYQEVQRILLNYLRDGVLLAINSKNNVEDVDLMFDKHHGMILKKQNFVTSKINWNDKATNIVEISNELNIGLDSIVFIDDDPAERGLIREALPQVFVPEFPKDISELPSMLKQLHCFDKIKITKEDLKRTKMYHTQVERKEAESKFSNLEDYLYDLKIEIKVELCNSINIPRVSQLINKTNQFNLRTQRYTIDKVENLMNSKNHVIYSVTVNDRFGELGLTGVLILEEKEDTWFLDTFLLSCRVMSRGIEQEFLRQVLKRMKEMRLLKEKKVVGEYIPTKKNEPVKDIYGKLGFVKEGRFWTLYPDKEINQVRWIKVIE